MFDIITLATSTASRFVSYIIERRAGPETVALELARQVEDRVKHTAQLQGIGQLS
jgi:hypothetical protein